MLTNMGGANRLSYRENREMHKAVCADCGQECEVPFKPDPSRPVTSEIVGQKDARAISTSVASTLLLCVDFVEQYIKFRENI